METLSRGLSRRTVARILGTCLATTAGTALAHIWGEARQAPPGLAPAPTPAPAPAVGLDDIVRLSANENPYGPSPAAFAAIQGAFDRASRYPDEEMAELAQEVGWSHGVGRSQVLLGAGSSEILKLAAAAFN